ncbi:PREDICTED: uncharacterized protein [Prunus dulcis]|uniref:PREDICTED: uncharacterized protein n=1 Tax=Prunus dulcis TaxID=3755 RepID=A0A5E4GFP9_PRUDU|nr:PREDICTED: uncharacterized protein [Prunus dulcis]
MDVTYDRRIYHGEEVLAPSSPTIEPNLQGNVQEIREDGEIAMEGGDTVDGKNNSNIDGMSMDKDNYERLLSEAQRELYSGCTEYTILKVVVELI